MNFTKLLEDGRFPSALIIEGDSRREVCREIFQAALGEKALRGFHPDLIQVGEDFGLEEVRKALIQLRQRPYEAGVRVLCIPDLTAQQIQIQNSLLKSLEEPSPRWILLLPVQSASQLLATIKSRCLVFRTPRMAIENLEDREAEIFDLVARGDDLGLYEKLEPFLKEREKSKNLFLNLLSAASAQKYPGHWEYFAPALTDGVLQLQRNLNQKLVWDHAWSEVRS